MAPVHTSDSRRNAAVDAAATTRWSPRLAAYLIISVAGAFYAFAAYAAVRYAMDIGGRDAGVLSLNASGSPVGALPRISLCALLGVLAWAFRSAGVHHMLQTQAFRERLAWARLDPERIAERGYLSNARARALTRQLRREALELRIANTNEVPA